MFYLVIPWQLLQQISNPRTVAAVAASAVAAVEQVVAAASVAEDAFKNSSTALDTAIATGVVTGRIKAEAWDELKAAQVALVQTEGGERCTAAAMEAMETALAEDAAAQQSKVDAWAVMQMAAAEVSKAVAAVKPAWSLAMTLLESSEPAVKSYVVKGGIATGLV